jgi:hypothetical protein
MSSTTDTAAFPWPREPTKDQWAAWIAAWLGWMLDAFDFTIFLLIMVPIAREFNVPLTEVTACAERRNRRYDVAPPGFATPAAPWPGIGVRRPRGIGMPPP